MNLDEQIEYVDTTLRGVANIGDYTADQLILSLCELRRLREVLDEIAFFDGTPMPHNAAQDFARAAKEARENSPDEGSE